MWRGGRDSNILPEGYNIPPCEDARPKPKTRPSRNAFFSCGGEGGIRTRDRFNPALT